MSIAKNNFIFILAAGRSERVNESKFLKKKQYIPLAGYPTFIWSLSSFLHFIEDNPSFSILLLYPKEEFKLMQHILYGYLQRSVLSKVRLVEGGGSRSESVSNALHSVKKDCHKQSLILIHDAARPFLNKQDVINVTTKLKKNVSVSLSYPVIDTILYKQAEYPPRNDLYHLVTPQGFHFDVLNKAHSISSSEATDDTQLVSKIGYPPLLIPGDRCNLFKISYASDLYLAEAYAHQLKRYRFSSKFFQKRL